MKKTLATSLILLFSFSISHNLYSALNPKAVMEWKETSIDLGDIPFDKPITVAFKFKNPGMVPLLISDVKPSCGCTVADYPKQPIGSGAEGQITVTFDAKSEGYFSKTISVYANSDTGLTELYIKGVVVK
jgi:hypothetical protein